MKARFLRNYRKQSTGNMVYVYRVTGSAKQLEEFKAAQGENLVIDEETGDVLWFTTRYAGDSVDLIITQNGKIVADTSEFDKAASLCQQYEGTALGNQLARVFAEKLLGNAKPSATPQAVPSAPTQEESPE